jgi:hypothetical protein
MMSDDIVRRTMRRGFRAYFESCMPTGRRQRAQVVEAESSLDIAREPRMPWGYRRQRPRPQLTMEPMRGFFAGVCEGKLEDCVICCETIQAGQRIFVLNCSDTAMHSFHEGCIGVWLEKKDSCPVCRAKVI